ncbi:hypothetical protein [Dyella sp.]|uniref:hypothetical protein n=1 Tax=Dyella sp. TaxID=1869338 RepID=UPI002ED4DA73
MAANPQPSRGKAAARLARDVLVPSWRPMRRTVQLLREESVRTVESAGRIKDMAREVGRLLKKPAVSECNGELPFEIRLARLKSDRAAWLGQYLRFLARKRVAVLMGCIFAAFGAYGLALGAYGGLVTMLVGGGLCAELAWLAEFRLWQLRGSFEAGQLADLQSFKCDPGAWRGAARLELGYGLTPPMRHYRCWLWAKRLGLAVMLTGALVGLTLAIKGLSGVHSAIACAGLGLTLALGIEARLTTLRTVLGRSSSWFTTLSFEIGAGYEGDA